MAKWGIVKDGEVQEVFATKCEAMSYVEVYGGDPAELVENLWRIESEWTEDDTNYITVERGAAAFCEVVDRIGLKPSKLAEVLGKTMQTIRLYRCGQRVVPKLVAKKVIDLDKRINGK